MLEKAPRSQGSVPNVVEKGIGISYPIEKPINRKGGYTDLWRRQLAFFSMASTWG